MLKVKEIRLQKEIGLKREPNTPDTLEDAINRFMRENIITDYDLIDIKYCDSSALIIYSTKAGE